MIWWTEKVRALFRKGFTKLGFLLNKESAFNKLTEDMATLMRKKEFDNKDEMRLSTLLAFYAMVSAIAQIGNEDDLGKVSAKKIPEGLISIEIPDQCYLTIKVTEPQTKLEVIDERCLIPEANGFDSLETIKGVVTASWMQ